MDSTIEITNRFRAMLGRLGTLQGPFVGVPLASGQGAFVARRDLIAQVVRNLAGIRVSFVDNDGATYLQINGDTAVGRHTSKLLNRTRPGKSMFDGSGQQGIGYFAILAA